MFGLAGIAERDISNCNECIGLCLDIIAEESKPARTSTWTDPDDFEQLVQSVLDDDLRQQLMASLETIRHPPRIARQLQCSFCDKTPEQIAKLIAGPDVCICDNCIGDAAAILLRV